MSQLTRRKFFEESMIAAGLAAAAQTTSPLIIAADSPRVSANDTLRHAVLGCRIRGRAHAKEFANLAGVDVTYVCDPDEQLVNELAAAVETQTGRRPKAVRDLRRIFDDPNVDTVSIASPNHWHALSAIWAMQAGKDVYVEKPVSHNVSEGRRIVQAARKTNRICQTGTQFRSRGDLAAAAKFIRSGKLGEVRFARCINYNPRTSIGSATKLTPPSHVDFNLWLGPAMNETITRQQFHYDWHWFWDTGNGELGNTSVHVIDVCRYMMGLDGLGDSVFSIGNRTLGDAGETPSSQIVAHTFGPTTIVQEIRNLRSDPFLPKFKFGAVIYGSQGYLAEGSLFDLDGNLVETLSGPNLNHFQNFIDAVRSRRREDLMADISEGHISSAMCHIGNISYRLGAAAAPDEIREQLDTFGLHEEVRRTFDRTVQHLSSHNIDLSDSPFRIGPLLKIDSSTESFRGNAAANALLTREYRQPFVLPTVETIAN